MSQLQKLAIDIGNTRTKLALFADKTLLNSWILPTENLALELPQVLSEIPQDIPMAVGWLSTASLDDIKSWKAWQIMDQLPSFHVITPTGLLPIQHTYRTPETLGADRIVAVVAACSYFPGAPVLVIDAGTAITYDFASAEGIYYGGGISPGIRMRFRALHEFTARLPMIDASLSPSLIGDSTETSIRSGVINGAKAEVEGIIKHYREVAGPSLKVFLTGGDREYFENQLKNINFAASNLVLEGINLCIQHLLSL